MAIRILIVFAAMLPSGWAASLPQGEARSLTAGAETLGALIAKLGDVDYKIREQATLKLWSSGETTLPALREAMDGSDPEISHRAGELIWKIELAITPEMDPAMVKKIERYPIVSLPEKVNILVQLIRSGASKQFLKLYAAEKSPEISQQFKDRAREVATGAAREEILKKDLPAARAFLELAPQDAAGLLALADFHRSQGTLVAEIERAAAGSSPAWQLALHRANGDLPAALAAAGAAGEAKLAAYLAVLMGDPLPWLKTDLGDDENGDLQRAYTEQIIHQWQEGEPGGGGLKELKKASTGKDEEDRTLAIHLLFLLGQTSDAEAALAKHAPFEAFLHLESVERVDEALHLLNLDPDSPQLAEWVKKRVAYLKIDDGDPRHDRELEVATAQAQLLKMANFLERRGLSAQAEAAFVGPLAELAAVRKDVFLAFLGGLVGHQFSDASSPLLAVQLAASWAKSDASRWQMIVSSAFRNDSEPRQWWQWLGEISPTAPAVERFEAMLALFCLTPDPANLREKWLVRAWQVIAELPAEKRSEPLSLLAYLADGAGPRNQDDSTNNLDAALGLKAGAALAAAGTAREEWVPHVHNLIAAERWNEAAEIFIAQIKSTAEIKRVPDPALYAYAGACLRLAKREKEAAGYDALADQLALGSGALRIGTAYALGRQYQKAKQWWMRGAIQNESEMQSIAGGLETILPGLLDAGKWKEAAAITEVLAQHGLSLDHTRVPAVAFIRLRMQADMTRALALLRQDRAKATALLEKCHGLFLGDASLADYFFPALRKAGLLPLHDRLFDLSWDFITRSTQQYPTSENTYNSAAWLASRARRNLDQAEKFSQKALALNPNQAAYLDTMAEIAYAKGDRAAALKWSGQAVNFAPMDAMIARQHERFRTAPLPEGKN